MATSAWLSARGTTARALQLAAAMRMPQSTVASRAAFGLQRSLSTSSALLNDKPLFDTILVANRGEIACRVIKTAQKLGIKAVAVYSEADAHALHVKLADEKFLLGPAPSSKSYLNIPRVMEAILTTGAQAVHPGYGFLSENAIFAAELEKHNIKFMGPGQHAVRVMGDKATSKAAAVAAGVNCIGGDDTIVLDIDEAYALAHTIGYPVMIKAVSGGGGRGMRRIDNDAEMKEKFELTKNESLNAFGDDRMLVEKFVVDPRHVEFQIMADTFGNTIYLNERECSIQRRNQKVIEEAPCTFLDPELRRAMGEQAVALAKGVDYVSAGTVEFLVDKYKNFYFLEMNTRLQVEHPITELISGVDLVEQMIRVAAGKPLSIKQEDVGINGHAIEARIYAEDPYIMLPSTGTLVKYQEPTVDLVPGVRVDSGVLEGTEINMFYDSMLSKLITWGPDRDQAIDRMKSALDNYVIKGLVHNIPMCYDLVNNPRFRAGDTNTGFIPEEYPEGFKGFNLTREDRTTERNQLIASAAYIFTARGINDQHFVSPTNNSLFERSEVAPESMFVTEDIVVNFHGEAYACTVDILSESIMEVHIGDESVIIDSEWQVGDVMFRGSVDEAPVTVQCLDRVGQTLNLSIFGTSLDVTVRSAKQQAMFTRLPKKPERDMSSIVDTPMPGTVISVDVQEGDEVYLGQQLAVVEAMKMQNQVKAARSGKIKKIYVKQGDALGAGDVIIEMEKEAIEVKSATLY